MPPATAVGILEYMGRFPPHTCNLQLSRATMLRFFTFFRKLAGHWRIAVTPYCHSKILFNPPFFRSPLSVFKILAHPSFPTPSSCRSIPLFAPAAFRMFVPYFLMVIYIALCPKAHAAIGMDVGGQGMHMDSQGTITFGSDGAGTQPDGGTVLRTPPRPVTNSTELQELPYGIVPEVHVPWYPNRPGGRPPYPIVTPGQNWTPGPGGLPPHPGIKPPAWAPEQPSRPGFPPQPGRPPLPGGQPEPGRPPLPGTSPKPNWPPSSGIRPEPGLPPSPGIKPPSGGIRPPAGTQPSQEPPGTRPPGYRPPDRNVLSPSGGGSTPPAGYTPAYRGLPPRGALP